MNGRLYKTNAHVPILPILPPLNHVSPRLFCLLLGVVFLLFFFWGGGGRLGRMGGYIRLMHMSPFLKYTDCKSYRRSFLDPHTASHVSQLSCLSHNSLVLASRFSRVAGKCKSESRARLKRSMAPVFRQAFTLPSSKPLLCF
jgi:hypothetical protein